MKTSPTKDDFYNVGFDHYFDNNVKIPKSILAGNQLYFYKGYNDAKLYREALNKKEDSDA
jgi:hypothetical protein